MKIEIGKTYRLKEDQLHSEDEATIEELKDSGKLGFVRRKGLMGASGDIVTAISLGAGLLVVKSKLGIQYYTRISNIEEIDHHQIIKITDNIYIENIDDEPNLVICPEMSDCGNIKLTELLEFIAKSHPDLYMRFVDNEMLVNFT